MPAPEAATSPVRSIPSSGSRELVPERESTPEDAAEEVMEAITDFVEEN
ncbi:MAG TPA: hypothetical protein VMT00_10695 [Thermoanaerobaculia bacterium]|nr:hypothetical protein [Thermoanaerobaculia bacterium]